MFLFSSVASFTSRKSSLPPYIFKIVDRSPQLIAYQTEVLFPVLRDCTPHKQSICFLTPDKNIKNIPYLPKQKLSWEDECGI